MSNALDMMSSDAQQAWWYQQAKTALKAFHMPDASIEWLAYTHHAVFKAQANSESYVLKLALPENSQQLKSEFHLLSTLSASGLGVSQAINHFHHAEFSAILLTFLEGISRDSESITNDDMDAIGEFLAKFHALDFDKHSHDKRLDWDGLFTNDGLYHLGAEQLLVFTDDQIIIMDEVAAQVKQAMETLGTDSDQFGLIHGDLLLKNILFDGDAIHALDFEYASLGYYLYDLTPLLWQLKPHTAFAHLQQSLLHGYSRIRPLDSGQLATLETLIAGRQVASMRWVASNQHNPYIVGKVDAILAQRTTELSSFLETGYLKRI